MVSDLTLGLRVPGRSGQKLVTFDVLVTCSRAQSFRARAEGEEEGAALCARSDLRAGRRGGKHT